ncbi:MAG: DUF1570 domain-containing protein [Cytophagales bacterium]|nr:DUF1570 domain-containing protein [Cytophagales bacterium]
MPVLLLISLHQFNSEPASTYRLGALSLPNFFSSTALTQDTTRLPRVEIIQPDSSVSPEVRDYLVRGIGFMYKFYITKFDYAFPEDLTVKIRVYRDLDDYKAYTSQVATSPISSHIGLYIHRLQEIVVWQGPDSARFTKTVFHETSHLLLRSQTHYCPRWLNEGLSEYFEELDLTGVTPVVHSQPAKDKRMKKRLPEGHLPTLESYLTQTNRQWSREDNHSDAPRTVAWSLVYYLMDTPKGQLVIKDMLDYYRTQPVDTGQSLRVVNTFAELDSFAFPRAETAVSFEGDWREWVAQERQEQPIAAESLPKNHLASVRKWLAMKWEE